MIKIINKSTISDIKSKIFELWDCDESDLKRIPAPEPVNLMKKDIPRIKKDYLATLKLEGTRAILFYMNKKLYLVNKMFDVFCIDQLENCDADDFLFDGVLIPGISPVYVVHDSVLCNKKFTADFNLIERLKEAETVVNSLVNKFALDVRMKMFLCANQISKFDSFNGVKADGIIFVPLYEPVGKLVQYTLFKWKPVKTMNLRILISNEKIQVFAKKNIREALVAYVPSVSPQFNEFLESIFKLDSSFKSGTVVKCEYRGSFIPLKIRCDKYPPDSFYNISKVIRCFSENIQFEDLVSALEYPREPL